MEIPKEAFENGILYAEEADMPELAQKISEYEDHAGLCRTKQREMSTLEKAFLVLNLTVALCVTAFPAGLLWLPTLGRIGTGIHAAVTLVCCLFLKDLRIAAGTSLLTFFLSPFFLVLTAADLVFVWFHRRLDLYLREQDGYPAFHDVQLRPIVHDRPRSLPNVQGEASADEIAAQKGLI